MKLQEIVHVLEEFAPPALQESYDNAGLITGNPGMEITGALLCLDTTEQVMDEALQTHCNLVIAHHPIVFSGLKRITGSSYVERVIIKAIKNDMAIYAAHTNLDHVHLGVNQKISEKLALKNKRILSPLSGRLMKLYTFVPHTHAVQVREALFRAGAGEIGNYDECSFNAEGYGTFRGSDETNPFAGQKGIQHREPETKIEVIFPSWLRGKMVHALKQAHPYEEVAYDMIELANSWEQVGAGMTGELEHPMAETDFLAFVREKLNATTIRYTPLVNPVAIKKIAVCGGSGSFLLKEALKAGADAFVTADFKYHQFFDAEGRIMICDIGHYESDQFTPEIFSELLRQKFPTFASRITSVNTNPIKYY